MLHLLKKAGYTSLETTLREQIKSGNITPGAAYEIARQVLDNSTITSPIIIALDNGIPERMDNKHHIQVIVRDYDLEGVNPEDELILKDENGNKYIPINHV